MAVIGSTTSESGTGRRPVRFGTFLAPHHPIGASPTLLLQDDLKLAEHLDELGIEEFWVGEHHSTGWEIISSPELFLAAAAMRTNRIKLGTGVVSLPYHHPFHVAERIVLLDHLSNGRVIFGSGPGAIPTDQWMLGLDPMVLRDRHSEALGVIGRLLAGEERFSAKSDWFDLKDAELQLLPVQKPMPMVASSALSPAGMKLAGKHGMGVLSVASNSTEGIQALPTQWSFAEESAEKHNQVMNRDDWRVVIAWHVAETREQAEKDVEKGLLHWHNEYKYGMLRRPGVVPYDDPSELLADLSNGGATGIGAAVVGTPDDLIMAINSLQEFTGGFGVALGFAHDWANREATLRSWELVAKYVAPAVNKVLRPQERSAEFVRERMPELSKGTREAVMSKIMEDESAAEAYRTTVALKEKDTSAFRPALDFRAPED